MGCYYTLMKHRVFVAIDLSEELKQKIGEMISQWRWLPIRWLPKENWHITLLPPRSLADDELELFRVHFLAKASGEPFSIHLSRALLAPPSISARMIWLEGEAPQEFLKLRKRLEALSQSQSLSWRRSSPQRLHATIARFGAGELKDLEAKTHVLGEVSFRFTVREIVLMQSVQTPEGFRYECLDRISLG